MKQKLIIAVVVILFGAMIFFIATRGIGIFEVDPVETNIVDEITEIEEEFTEIEEELLRMEEDMLLELEDIDRELEDIEGELDF